MYDILLEVCFSVTIYQRCRYLCLTGVESVRLEDVSLVKIDDRSEKLNVIVVLVNASVMSVGGYAADISQM